MPENIIRPLPPMPPSKLPPKPAKEALLDNDMAESPVAERIKSLQPAKESKDPYKKYFGGVETGRQFKETSTLSSLRKRFSRFKTYARSVSANISPADAERMRQIIASHLKRYPTGAKLGWRERRQILTDAWNQTQRKIGAEGFSRQDYEDFKRIVDTIVGSNK